MAERQLIELEQSKEKSGNIWERKTFICSNKNIHKGCTCKSIEENLIIEAVRNTIKDEIKKIDYADSEILDIYQKAEQKVNKKIGILKKQLEELKKSLKENEQQIKEVYNDKLKKVITIDDFNIFYDGLLKEKDKLLEDINRINLEITNTEKGSININYDEIKNIANKILSAENPSKELYSKLIERIEFDSEKNITVTLTFVEATYKLKNAV